MYVEDLDIPQNKISESAQRVIDRKPAEQILAYAREHAVDLIVMGRDGHGSPTAAASLGSVAQAVARQAPCPVLLVPATDD